MATREMLAHLTDGANSVIILGDGGMPEIVHWGEPLGLQRIDPALFDRPVVGGGLDVDPPVGIVTEASRGWFGRPGLEIHRSGGHDFSPRFTLESTAVEDQRFTASLRDEHAMIHLTLELELTVGGVLTCGAALRNDGQDALHVGALRLALPVPQRADEVMTAGGRHNLEFATERVPWHRSSVVVENRHGKTSHERLGAVFAGTAGFGEHAGEVWACHIGWSGNYELVCDAITDARKVIQAGEVLLAGEIELAPGESYRTPTVYGARSAVGLNAISHAFHAHLRGRPNHPQLPRPIHLNTWEAVYFDHDTPTLMRLADAAAEVGIERFVLDDGWFGGRRDDTVGLGDWWVSADAWPEGLTPLISHVCELGMEFGIWVEPEMVNPDSELFRSRPEWV